MADADKIFFNKIITGDETWCVAYDSETKRHISEWVDETSPRPKRLKFRRSHNKTMLITFFDSQGVVHKEFVPEGKTVNAESYEGVMDCLLKRIQRVRPAAFCSRDFSCCTIMPPIPPHKDASISQILPPKKIQPFITPRILQIYLRQTISSSPS